MAASQMPGFPANQLEELNLSEKIERSSKERGTDPSSTLVNIDLSNVNNWRVERQVGPSASIQYRVSPKSLARLLSKGPYFKEVRVFMPSVDFTDELVNTVTDWALREYPDVFCDRRFESDDDAMTFGLKLGMALDHFLDYQERRAISTEIQEKVEAVIRGAYFSMNAEMFIEAGCNIYRRSEVSRAKSLASDRSHSRVVAKILDKLDQIDQVNVGAVAVGSDITYVQSSVTSRLAKIKELTAAAREIVQHDQSQHRKCDLDVDIATEAMDPVTLANFENQVFLTGDGDFERLYRKLNEVGKNVIVASPDEYLSTLVKKLASSRMVTLHKPNFVDPIWREAPSRGSSRQ